MRPPQKKSRFHGSQRVLPGFGTKLRRLNYFAPSPVSPSLPCGCLALPVVVHDPPFGAFSVLYWNFFNLVDDQNLNRRPLRLETQVEIFQDGSKDRRPCLSDPGAAGH